MTRCWIFLAAMIIGLNSTAQNMISNPGFEDGNATDIPSWSVGKRAPAEGNAEISEGIFHSGKKSLHIKATNRESGTEAKDYGNVSISAQNIQVPPPGTELWISLWMKTKDVIGLGKYHKARAVIYFFDKDNKKIRHQDIVCREGSFDWLQFKSKIAVPENTEKINLSFGVSSGEIWIDDVEIKIDAFSMNKKKIMADLNYNDPIVIPRPWKSIFKDGQITVDSISIQTMNSDSKANPFLHKILKTEAINTNAENPSVTLVTGNSGSQKIDEVFKREFPENKWEDIGNQGYFISIAGNDICIGANTEEGRFYGIQTFRQLLEKKDGKTFLRNLSLLDKPTISKRGVILGLQWFGKKEEAVKRMTNLKCNVISLQGSFMRNLVVNGYKSGSSWREPFSENGKRCLENFLKLCDDNFIEIVFGIGPRGEPQTCYSSDKDINTLCDKMEELYKIGFRHLRIDFDDLQNTDQHRLKYEEDIKKFGNDFGKAHQYFVQKVFEKLKIRCPEADFSVLPYIYGSGLKQLPEPSLNYLKDLSKATAADYWTACLYSYEDILISTELAGNKKPFIWDNYYASKLTAFPNPIARSNKISDDNIRGYMFLPALQTQEDASQISWINAADYEWSPERYNPEDSYKRAIAFVAKDPAAIKLLEEYSSFSLKIDNYDFPTVNREARLATLRDTLAKLDAFLPKFKILPENLAAALQKDVEKYKENISRIEVNLNKRPYPCAILLKDNAVYNDANALRDFIPLGKSKEIQDTKAWLTYDKENLYIRVVCDEPDMKTIKAQRTDRDSNIFLDDSIEIFIVTDKEDSSGDTVYYQFVVNSLGAVFDSKNINRKFNYINNHYPEWNSNISVKPEKTENSWVLEIAIPLKDIGIEESAPGKRIFLNICRNRKAGNSSECSCYALLLKGSFHDPMSFWPMEFK